MNFRNPQLKLIRRPGVDYWWVTRTGGELVACDRILRKKVDIKGLEEIRIEAVRRPSADTFETRIKKKRQDRAYFIEFPKTTLVTDFSEWLAVQHHAGRKYIRVTYRPTKTRP